MPTPGQMNTQNITREQFEAMKELEQRSQPYGGAIRGAGNSAMSQDYSALFGQIAALMESIDALRAMLSPPSAVILTGSEVARQFERLTSENGVLSHTAQASSMARR